MTPLALTLILAWRDPARNLALVFGAFAVFIFAFLGPVASPYWVILLIAPAFLISTAISVPTFSPFERALPITVSQLLWSRVLASLTLAWLPLLLGNAFILAAGESTGMAGTPIQSVAFFTASACLATSARLTASPGWSLLPRPHALAACVPAQQSNITVDHNGRHSGAVSRWRCGRHMDLSAAFLSRSAAAHRPVHERN